MLSIADGTNGRRQARARERVAAQERHHRICRELERRAPLARYYGPRPLLAVPIGHYYVRGRRVA